jgi:hypothetical protein
VFVVYSVNVNKELANALVSATGIMIQERKHQNLGNPELHLHLCIRTTIFAFGCVRSVHILTMEDGLDDDYVANLLKEDAKKASKNASVVGIRAYMPQRYVILDSHYFILC